MDQIIYEVRLARWKEVIGQCQLRPEGQTIRDWCIQNNVSEKRYYYWQRRIRLKIAEGMAGSLVPVTAENARQVMFTDIRRRELKDIRTKRVLSDPALYRVTAGSLGRAATRWLRTEVWKKERIPRI